MLRIVIGHRGWVWIGRMNVDGDNVVLYDARCIRRWGTRKGLGELAEGGPTSKTVLDMAGTVRLSKFAIIATMDANEEAWAGK